MSRSTRASTPARRDAGLRRLRTLNRVLIGTAVVGTGLLSDVAAHAFPGHKRAATTTTALRPDATRRTAAGTRYHRRHHSRDHARPALRPPAHAPTAVTSSSSTAPASAVTTAAPQPAAPQAAAPQAAAPQAAAPAAAPQPVPAPAPVVSGGS